MTINDLISALSEPDFYEKFINSVIYIEPYTYRLYVRDKGKIIYLDELVNRD